MAGLAPDRARSAEVRKLAVDIKKAQGPEIKTLSGWLTSWGEEVPAEGAMDHSSHGMGGMMTAEEMNRLEDASGKAFDTAFMEMMIKHHEGAVEMAKTEQSDGAHGPAKKMAGEIITSQSAGDRADEPAARQGLTGITPERSGRPSAPVPLRPARRHPSLQPPTLLSVHPWGYTLSRVGPPRS